jgi:hypothetical protein
MKRLRVLGACLVAVLVVGAIVAVGASAQAPEYGRCEKAPKVGKAYAGEFTNAGCTTKSEAKTGKYEWHPGVVKKFQTSSGGKAVLEEVGKYQVGCESESSTGEYVGTKEVANVRVRFKGCKVVPFVCTTAGLNEGELETVPLEGRVVWEKEKEHKAALDLYPGGGAEKFIEFTCGTTLTVAVRGSILVNVPVDKMSDTVTLKYKGKHGFQGLEYFEEGGVKVKDVLEADFAGKGYDQADQIITSIVKNEEKLELNAYI